MRRTLLVGVVVAIVAAACGGQNAASEYVEDLNALSDAGRSDFEAAAVAYAQSAEPTLADEVAFLEQEVAIRHVFLEGIEALDPPGSAEEVHQLLVAGFARLTTAAEDLASYAAAADSIEEVEQTPEFAEYRAANDDGARMCVEVQERLDDLATTGDAFATEPWISGLSFAVRAVIGCGEVETG
jgi:hypothetical protein